ncbi:hypothetical protein G7046_g4498 [Stylonectria norvegica]|nr:hypothetical protein G7046_g4498 [Stylonectria norvegica]
MFKTFKNLSPKTRAGVGVGILAWGAVGLYLSDRAEEKFGYTPTEQDKAALSRYTPKLITIERNQETTDRSQER